MAKLIKVTYLKAFGDHAAGTEGTELEDDVHELMRQGIARWLEPVADAVPAPAPVATPPPEPKGP